MTAFVTMLLTLVILLVGYGFAANQLWKVFLNYRQGNANHKENGIALITGAAALVLASWITGIF